jgi:hypothetical protein
MFQLGLSTWVSLAAIFALAGLCVRSYFARGESIGHVRIWHSIEGQNGLELNEWQLAHSGGKVVLLIASDWAEQAAPYLEADGWNYRSGSDTPAGEPGLSDPPRAGIHRDQLLTPERQWRKTEIGLPYWVLILAVLPWLGLSIRGAAERRRRLRYASEGRCPDCGQDLAASPDQCPQCGTQVTRTSSRVFSLWWGRVSGSRMTPLRSRGRPSLKRPRRFERHRR